MVLGATGLTGSLVARELAKRGAPLMLGGRDEARLGEAEASLPARPIALRVCDPTRPSTLLGAFDGCGAVITTIGPFLDLGEWVLAAALAQGVHYFDSSSEQAFVHRMIQRYDQEARDARLVALCSAGFEFSVGSCAAAMALRHTQYRADRVDVCYAVRGSGASPATWKSILRGFGEPTWIWTGGNLVAVPPMSERAVFEQRGGPPLEAVLMPGAEPLQIYRYAAVTEVRTFQAFPDRATTWLNTSRRALSLMRFPAFRGLADRWIDWRVVAPLEAVRRATGFEVIARATLGKRRRFCVVRGHDPYAVSAYIAAESALRVLDQAHLRVGVLSTALAFDVKDFLDRLAPAGVTWEVYSDPPDPTDT
jgi:short subunit dehydrogenase-like uncharacterized protein